MTQQQQVLLIGSGGREHALSWKLTQSPLVKHVFVAPGNAGTQKGSKTSNIGLSIKDHSAIIDFCKANDVSLVAVGPEDPLANGIADVLSKAQIKCFGPSQRASQIEASKEFAKAFMDRHSIPTARWKSFVNPEDAKKHILSAPYEALVLKASGLAAGKGVVVCSSREEAVKTVDILKQEKSLGTAAEIIVIEELLKGEEVSVLCFTDGKSVAVMPPAQDHKRVGDGDTGSNTGGMGAYCPCPQVSKELLEEIRKNVLQKAVDGMREEGYPYVGVLYAGLMLTDDGPKVLEYNCRFGDPETQAILPLLKSDLYEVMVACVDGKLSKLNLEWFQDRYAVGVVLASAGYPGSYPKGKVITGTNELKSSDTLVFHAGTAQQGDSLVTSGGRVLAVVSLASDLATAVQNAQKGATTVKFDGAYHRNDIAHRALKRFQVQGMTYKTCGVDITSGDTFVQDIKKMVKNSFRPGVIGNIGGFGALFDVKAAGYTDPCLVSGTDGVGTKLKVAQSFNKHDTVGIDLVAMCVNDILSQGAEPLFFLDYFACGKLDTEIARQVLSGICTGCELANSSLIGGETAEMPGMYSSGDYDLAGFSVGAVDKGRVLPMLDKIVPGDVVIGISSSGVHSNGFSLIRKLIEIKDLSLDSAAPFDESQTLGHALLTPTKIYVKALLPAIKKNLVKAAAHITGGGLTENIPRVLPATHGVVLDANKWTLPPVFNWIVAEGRLSSSELLKTFNCGLGMVLIVGEDKKDAVLNIIQSSGEEAAVIGSVKLIHEGEPQVEVQNLKLPLLQPVKTRRKVGVLISGSGTNLQALIDYTQNPSNQSSAEIVLVLSNIPGVEGLKRAERANIPTRVLSHRQFKSRVEFDRAVTKILQESGVELICLAGFMRIVSAEFVKTWQGKILNVHPALLPAFKGMDAHKQVLEMGARITGCTVHLVEPEVDAGAIIEQAAVRVEVGDTVETLQERVKVLEHQIFPKALELLASGKISRGEDGKLIWHA